MFRPIQCQVSPGCSPKQGWDPSERRAKAGVRSERVTGLGSEWRERGQGWGHSGERVRAGVTVEREGQGWGSRVRERVWGWVQVERGSGLGSGWREGQ